MLLGIWNNYLRFSFVPKKTMEDEDDHAENGNSTDDSTDDCADIGRRACTNGESVGCGTTTPRVRDKCFFLKKEPDAQRSCRND